MAPLRRLDDDSLLALPVFPLPNAVLFPGMALPLHVFEERYRALAAHCLAHRGAIAIALLQPGFEAEYEDRPAILPVLGAGFIVAHEELPDGRYNLIVQGTDRVKLAHEHPATEPFRCIHAVRLDEVLDTHTLDADATLRALLYQLGSARAELGATLGKLLAAAPTPSRLADLVAASMLTEAADRQRALETLDVTARIRWLTHELGRTSLAGVGMDHGGLAS